MNHSDDLGSAPGSSPQSRSSRRARILVAEDDSEMRALITWALQQEGYIVHECRDGNVLKKQLDRSGSRSTNVEFDLVVSDIRMPGLTGLEVLERAEAQGERPPMILISAFCDQETEDIARRLGAEELLPKPFSNDQLIARVKRSLPPDVQQSTR